MGGGQPSETKQVNEVKLSPEQKQVFNLAFPHLQQYAQNPVQMFQGSTVAGFNPWEVQAQGMALDAAGVGQGLATGAANTNAFLMDPALLDPQSNPWLAKHGDAIANTMGRQLTEHALPALRAGDTQAGGMYSGGNTRSLIAEGLASARASEATGDALSSLYNNAYSTGLGTMSDALRMSPLTQASQLFGAQTVGAVGSQSRALEQSLLDETVRNWYMQQQMPLLHAQDLFGMLGTMPGGQGVSTVTGAQPSTNPVMAGLGGAAMGASLAPMLGATGPIGAGVGLLAALLMNR